MFLKLLIDFIIPKVVRDEQTTRSSNELVDKKPEGKCKLKDAEVLGIINAFTLAGIKNFNIDHFATKCTYGLCNLINESNDGFDFSPCRNRIVKYETETKSNIKQESDSSNRISGKWTIYDQHKDVRKILDSRNTVTKSIKNSPITSNYVKTLRWYRTEKFSRIKQAYDDAFGFNNVYFRIVETGVTALSLDLDCPSFIGINPTRDVKMCDIHTYSEAYNIEEYYALRKNFDENYKASINRKSMEDKAVMQFIKFSLQNDLALLNFPDGCFFINNEWQFFDFYSKARRADVMGINTNNNSLVIIEFKSNKRMRDSAIKQVKDYSALYIKDKADYDKYFSSQLRALSKLYLKKEFSISKARITSKPELYIGYPQNDEIIIEKVI